MSLAPREFNPRGLYLERVGDASNGYKEIYFIKADSRIGRAESMDHAIKLGKTVSREQARITFKNGRMYVENLSKTNYTFLNDDRIVQCSEVEEGDLIGLGTRPNGASFNPSVPENQKFVYKCKQKNDVEEVIILSDDDNDENHNGAGGQTLTAQDANNDQMEQNNNLSSTKKNLPIENGEESSKDGRRIESSNLVEKKKEHSAAVQVSNQSKGAVEKRHGVTMKFLRVVLYKMTAKEISEYQKRSKSAVIDIIDDSSSDEDEPKEVVLSISSKSCNEKQEPKKTATKNGTAPNSLKKPRRDSIFHDNPEFQNRHRDEKLHVTKKIQEKLKAVVDDDSDDQGTKTSSSMHRNKATPSGLRQHELKSTKSTEEIKSMKPVKRNHHQSFSSESSSSSAKKMRTSISSSKHESTSQNKPSPSTKSSDIKPHQKSTEEKGSNDGHRKQKISYAFPKLDSSTNRETIVKSSNNALAQSSSSVGEATPSMSTETAERSARQPKRRQSSYVRPSSPKLITGEFDMFAIAARRRDEMLAQENEAKVTTKLNAPKMRRMSSVDRPLQIQKSTASVPETSSRASEVANRELKARASVPKVKFTTNNRGECFTQSIALPPRRASTAQRPFEELPAPTPSTSREKVITTTATIANSVVRPSSAPRFSVSNVNAVINSNMETLHRELFTAQTAAKSKELENKPIETKKAAAVVEKKKSIVEFYNPREVGNDNVSRPSAPPLKEQWVPKKVLQQHIEEEEQQSNQSAVEEPRAIEIRAAPSVNVRSILKISTTERIPKTVTFKDDDKLVSVLEISPKRIRSNSLQIQRAVVLENPRCPIKIDGHYLSSVAKIRPFVSPPSTNVMIGEAIDEILKWNPSDLRDYEKTVENNPILWSYNSLQNSYSSGYEYLHNLKRIASVEMLKKISNAYRDALKKTEEFLWLKVKDRKVVDGKIKLTLIDDSERLKVGGLVLLRARDNDNGETEFLGYVTSRSHNKEFNMDIMSTTVSEKKSCIKGKPLLQLRNEVYSLVATQYLGKNLILEKIINPNLNCLEPTTAFQSSSPPSRSGDLTPEQEQIVSRLCIESSRDDNRKILVINGGPGAGKTRVMIETIKRIVFASKGQKSFLICASSNPAIDHIASIFSDINSVKAVRIGNDNKMNAIARKMSLEDQAREIVNHRMDRADAEKEIMLKANVVLTTIVSSCRLWDCNKTYDMCFIEGANHVTDCDLAIPVKLESKKLILIGDRNQPIRSLNPIRTSTAQNTPLFTRLMDFFKDRRDGPIFTLVHQHRVGKELFSFCNRLLFKNKMVLGKQNNASHEIKPYKIFGVNMQDFDSTTQLSQRMVAVVLELCLHVPERFTVGVFAMSKEQRGAIRKGREFKPQRMQLYSYELAEGIEHDVTIIIITEKDLCFIPKTLYNLLTRATRATYIFVDLKIVNFDLWKDPNLRELYLKAERHHHYYIAEPMEEQNAPKLSVFSSIKRYAGDQESAESS